MVLNTETKSQFLFSEILCFYRVRPKRPGMLFTEGRAAGLRSARLAALKEERPASALPVSLRLRHTAGIDFLYVDSSFTPLHCN